MAFPSSTTKDSLASVWSGVQARASQVRIHAQELRNASAAGPVSGKNVVDFATLLADAVVMLDRAAAVPGIAQYARDQIGDQVLDVVAEFTAMRAVIIATRDWIMANFPKDGSGYLLLMSFTADGRYTFRTLTTAQTAGLRTQLDALIATIA